MTSKVEYFCTVCGKHCGRANLTGKKVMFLALGKEADTYKTRMVDWLCADCLKKDPAWNLPAYQSPGTRARRRRDFASPRTET